MNLKSLMLGGAAVLVSASAFAADLPSTKSAPAQYVRICDVYGAGFFYVPGTDTCLRIGGRVRVEYMTQTVGNVWRHRSLGGTTNSFIHKNGIDSIGWHSRARLDMDARTQTAWGTVQTVIQMRLRSRSGTYAANYTSGTYAAGNSFDPTLERAWIRFAGFTFGRGSSNFTTMPSTMYNSQYWGGFASGVNQLAYTATFGGGFSATLALEDRTDFSAASTNKALTGLNAVGGTNAVAVGFGATRLPALTGNLRVDQSWGSLQLSGAVIQNTANITTAGPAAVVNANGPLIKKTGWAVALGGHINLPMLARGDRFDFTVGYADGHMDMIFGGNLNGKTSSSAQYMGGLQRNDVNLTVYDCSVAAGIQSCSETTKGWNIGGILTHYWTPTVRSRVAGSYISVAPGSVTRRTDWLNGGLSRATAWTAVHQLEWTPTRGFFIGFELAYARLNQKFAGLNGAAPGAIPVAAGGAACTTGVAGCAVGFANFKVSPNIWNARIRVQRDF